MARRTKMTLSEYIKNREDMTAVTVAESTEGWEIVVRIDGSYASKEVAEDQAKFVAKTLGIRYV